MKTMSLSQAIERYEKNGLARCEISQSTTEIGCMNLLLFAEQELGSDVWCLEAENEAILEIVSFEYAFEMAFRIGFALEQIDISMDVDN